MSFHGEVHCLPPQRSCLYQASLGLPGLTGLARPAAEPPTGSKLLPSIILPPACRIAALDVPRRLQNKPHPGMTDLLSQPHLTPLSVTHPNSTHSKLLYLSMPCKYYFLVGRPFPFLLTCKLQLILQGSYQILLLEAFFLLRIPCISQLFWRSSAQNHMFPHLFYKR